MIKNVQTFLIFTFTFLSAFSLSAQDVTHPTDQFKGKVQKVYESNTKVFLRKSTWSFDKYDFQYGVISKFDDKGNYKSNAIYIFPGDPFITNNFKVNAKGNFVSSEGFNTTGPVSKVRFHENNSGKIDSVIYTTSKDKKQFRINTYEYKKKQLIAYTHAYLGQDTFRVEYKRAKGKIIEETYFNKSGAITSIKKHQFNKEGDPTLTMTYDTENKLINKESIIYQYDKKGNWVKKLSTDFNLDQRILSERSIIYKNAPTQNITAQELMGYWKGWENGTKLEVKKSLAKISIKTLFRSNDLEGDYSYSASTGILTINSQGWQKKVKDFYTSFDGTILTLESHDDGNFYHLKKIGMEDLSPSERNEYKYKSTVEKPTAKSYKENEKYGLKSKSGEILFSPKYESVYAITNDLVKVTKDGKNGLADYQGKLVSECKYDAISRRQLGYFRVEINRKKGLLTPEGKEIVAPIYDNIWVDPAGVIIVEKDNKKGILSFENKVLAEPKYNSFGKSHFNRIFAYSGGFQDHDWYDSQYHLIKKIDRVTNINAVDINSFKYRGGGGWGLLDSLGNVIMEPQFDELRRASAQLLIASNKDDKYGLVNAEGKQITDLNYDRILTEYNEDYNNDLEYGLKDNKAAALFLKGNQFGYLDGFGNEIAPRISPSINRKHAYKIYEKANGFLFKYPAYWKQNGPYFTLDKKDTQVGFICQEVIYSGDFRQWVLENSGGGDLLAEKINGISTLGHFKETNMNRYIHFEKIVYYPISETRLVRITTYCHKYHYLKYAQTFYDVIHSLKLKE